jgi:hypothetical protein
MGGGIDIDLQAMLRHLDPATRQILRSSRPRHHLRSSSARVPRAAVGILQRQSEPGVLSLVVWTESKRSVPLRDPELQGGGKPL